MSEASSERGVARTIQERYRLILFRAEDETNWLKLTHTEFVTKESLRNVQSAVLNLAYEFEETVVDVVTDPGKGKSADESI